MPRQGANSSESKKMHWFLLLAKRQVNFWGKCKKKTSCYEKWSQMLHMKVMKMMSRKAIMWWKLKGIFCLDSIIVSTNYNIKVWSTCTLHYELIYHDKCHSFLFHIRTFNACLKIWPFYLAEVDPTLSSTMCRAAAASSALKPFKDKNIVNTCLCMFAYK